MSKEGLFCRRCKEIEGREVRLLEINDTIVCPSCKTTLFNTSLSPLRRYQESWVKNAEDVFVFIRPPLYQPDLNSPRLFFLYEECYHTLLIGKNNASIVLMGVLLESLMKERIQLKLGIDFDKDYGRCLDKIERERLMEPRDTFFLRWFKDVVRNLYIHGDEAKILEGILVPVYPLEFKGELSLKKLEDSFNKVKSGEQKPKLLPASEVPAIRSVVKQAYDKKRAIELFNQVYDFLLLSNIKYFKQKEYEEHNKKFGSKL
jgi:hypothetical protein